MTGGYEPAKFAELDRYLDGQLDAAERVAFERRLATDTELRAAVDRQQAIDAALRRRFAAPDAATLLDRALANGRTDEHPSAKKPASAATRVGLLRRYSAAAAIIIVVTGAGLWIGTEIDDWSYRWNAPPAPKKLTLPQVYFQKIRDGFKPDWLCENDQQFASTFYFRLGEGLLLTSPLPSDVKVLGIGYAYALSERTTYLMAEVRGEKVLVFVDKNVNRLPEGGEWCGNEIRMFERKIGPLVLYEASLLSEPQLLSLFYIPVMPEEWKLAGPYGPTLTPPPTVPAPTTAPATAPAP